MATQAPAAQQINVAPSGYPADANAAPGYGAPVPEAPPGGYPQPGGYPPAGYPGAPAQTVYIQDAPKPQNNSAGTGAACCAGCCAALCACCLVDALVDC
mmetsp:Transcript_4445/g.10304  ORF Transcript_4445/g.10304 Transcript_4445/m.10304 type:complete len:99 (-) Transcript_4445:261-557(-)